MGGAKRRSGQAVPFQETAAQGDVALTYLAQGIGQGGRVEGSTEAQGHGHGVEMGFPIEQAIEEPQAFLGKGDLGFYSLRGGRDGQGHGVFAALDAHGEFGKGGGIEDRPHLELALEDRPQSRHQADGQQRLAAHLEEVGVTVFRQGAEQLAEEFGQDLFGGAPGWLDNRVSMARTGLRQSRPVDLVVGGAGQLLQGNPGTGHHVGGQPLCQFSRELIHRGMGRPRGVVGHQPEIPRRAVGAIGARQNHRFPHPRQFCQGVLDLPGFDAETPQFHLVIDAAKELQHAIGPGAGAVPGAVESFAPGGGHEALGGEGGATGIAEGEAVSTHPQFPLDADGGDAPSVVHHLGTRAQDGSSDGYGGLEGFPWGHPVGAGEGGVLGGAVAVYQATGEASAQSLHVGHREGLASRQELTHPVQVSEAFVHHQVEEAGGEPQGAHPLAHQAVGQLFWGREPWRQEDESPTVHQGAPNLEGGGVEGQGGVVEQGLLRRQVHVVRARH